VGVALFTPALFSVAVDGIPANERGAVVGTTSTRPVSRSATED
jgi:hypothetical protein